MTKLLQRLHDELVRCHYATTTRESYLRILKAFAATRVVDSDSDMGACSQSDATAPSATPRGAQ